MTPEIRFKTITSLQDVVPHASLAPRVVPRRVLMCPPTYFEVKDANNAFMADNIGGVDWDKAQQQWSKLKETIENCGFPVEIIEPIAGFEDMVFTANQVLPFAKFGGEPSVIVGQMAFPTRQREVPFFEKWFQAHGYNLLSIPADCERFEGGGDGIWHADLGLLWVGVGQRTSEKSCDELARILEVPVVKLKLVSPKFYHLDTAFAVLDSQSVLVYPGAFDRTGLELIRFYFKNVVEISESDANNFAGNAFALDRNVILQRGSISTCEELGRLQFVPHEVDTSEFMKSGGSVYCMTQMVY